MRKYRFLLPATALALCLAPGFAHAQQHSPRIEDRIARNHFENGNEYFRIGRYADAAREFEHAFEISHQNELLYNIGWAYELGGDLPNALTWYERFEQAGAPGMNRDVLTERMANLRTRVNASSAAPSSTPANANVSTTASSEPVAHPSPPEASASPSPPIHDAHYEYRRSTLATVGPWVAIGAGAVLGGLGIWQGITYANDNSLVSEWGMGHIMMTPAVTTALGRLNTDQILTGVFAGVGGAAIVGGVLWLVLRGPGERVEVTARPSAFVLPTRDGAIAGVGGSF